MHEFGICQNIVNIACNELKKLEQKNVRVLKLRVKVGSLHAIVNENLEMAYSILTKDTDLHGSRLELISIPVEAECKDCGYRSRIKDNFFVCAQCNSGNLEIIKGQELYIENLEVAYEEDGD
ncbi:MAG: hydrogenase maturation nickel metallochaperone HypA [Spirochaetales bacterium]|nr:hydrogenase maturation nickel metallochaperone HypA [Spirochaetales bacterium]